MSVRYNIISYVLNTIFDLFKDSNAKYMVVNQPFCFLVGNEHNSVEYQILKMIYSDEKNTKENIEKMRKEYPENIFISICKKCIHKEYCIGIPEKYIEYYGDKEFNFVVGNKLF